MDNYVEIGLWDASEYLESKEDIDSYLETVYEIGDSEDIATALENVAKARQRMGLAAEKASAV